MSFRKQSLIFLMTMVISVEYGQAHANMSPSIKVTDQTQGWLWYQDPALEKKHLTKPNPQVTQVPLDPQIAPKPKTYQQQMDAQRQAFDEALSKSILEPTLDNVIQTQRLQAQILGQAGNFQKVWMAAETMTTPFQLVGANPKAREITSEQNRAILIQKIHAMSQDYGLFFMFKSTCQHCHAFAPTVKRFASLFNFELQTISGDGKGIAGVDHFLPDNGIGAVINPKHHYPYLLIIHKRTKVCVPIATTLLSDDQLIDHMKYIITYFEIQHRKTMNNR